MPLALASSFHLHYLAGITSNLNVNPRSFSFYLLNSHYHYCNHIPTVISSMEDLDTKKKTKKIRVREAQTIYEAVEGGGDIEDFSPEETLKIRVSLLQWYYENQRVLPWRINQNEEEEEEEESDARAYAVWVSEVMLQQTRVPTVIDYFNRWMKKWPTVHHLAQASQEEVNDMWAGLGYYRRARFLLEGAKMIVEGGGEFPKTVSDLRKVRGIGDYTAGAIASIAFKKAVPVVDGNVIRVIARLRAISSNPKESETIKSIWKLAGQLVDPFRPGDFNQALMELGSTKCTPSNPSCSTCPVSGHCRALSISRNRQSVKVTDYPTKVIKAKPRSNFSAVCVVEISGSPDNQDGSNKRSEFLLVKRPDEGLLAGLWEFPSVLLDGEADSVKRRGAINKYLKKSFKIDTKKNCSIILREDIGEFVHVFTHIRLRMYVELLVLHPKGGLNIWCGKENKDTMAWKCIDGNSLQSTGLTSGVRKVYNMIQKFKQNNLLKNPTNSTKKRTPRR